MLEHKLKAREAAILMIATFFNETKWLLKVRYHEQQNNAKSAAMFAW